MKIALVVVFNKPPSRPVKRSGQEERLVQKGEHIRMR